MAAVTDRLRGVEQVGQPDEPVAVPIDEAGPVLWLGATKNGIASRRQDRSLIAGWIPVPPGADVEVHRAGTRQRLADLEAIVRDLAASDPIWLDEVCGCKHCSNEFNDYEHAKRAGAHSSWCRWRLAVEFVSAHPVSGTDQP